MLYKLNPKTSRIIRKVKRDHLSGDRLERTGFAASDVLRIFRILFIPTICSRFSMSVRGRRKPDILAIDRNGDLYILELKRWSSDRENLLQVLRYGQLYGSSNYDELNELFQKYSKSNAELLEIHKQYFDSSG